MLNIEEGSETSEEDKELKILSKGSKLIKNGKANDVSDIRIIR